MSMIPSGMAAANPFSPLHQSLIHTMPNAALMGQGPIPQSDQDNTLMRAHNLRSGKPGSGQMTPDDRSGGPMGQSVAKYKTLMMAAAGLSDEDKKKFEPALDDPYISPQALNQLLQMHAKVKGGQQPVQQPPMNQPSIGGPTPANVPQGSIRITQGSGKDGRPVMSQSAMQQWMQRAQQTAPQGEQVHQISGSYTPTLDKAGMDEWNRSNPGQPLPTRSTPVENAGFQVNGIQPPAQQQAAANPMAGLFQAFKQAGIDDNGLNQLQAYSQAGATPQQVHQAAQQMLSQKHQAHTQGQADQRADRQIQQQEFSNNGRVLDELQRQERTTLEAHPELKYGPATDPNVQKDWVALHGQIQSVQSRMQQSVTPQQSQGRQPPPQAAPAPQAVARNAAGQVLHFINGQWTPAQ